MWNSFSPSELLPPEAVCLFELIEEADTHTKTRVVRSPLLAQACGDSFGVRLHIFEHALSSSRMSEIEGLVSAFAGYRIGRVSRVEAEEEDHPGDDELPTHTLRSRAGCRRSPAATTTHTLQLSDGKATLDAHIRNLSPSAFLALRSEGSGGSGLVKLGQLSSASSEAGPPIYVPQTTHPLIPPKAGYPPPWASGKCVSRGAVVRGAGELWSLGRGPVLQGTGPVLNWTKVDMNEEDSRCAYCKETRDYSQHPQGCALCAAAHCVLCHVQIDKVVCRRCVFPWKRSYSSTCKAVPPEVKLDQGRWLCVLCIWERKYSIEIPEEDLTDTVRMQLRKFEDNYKVTLRGLYRKEQARRGIANPEPGGEEEDDAIARWMTAAREAVRPFGVEGGGIAK